MGRRWARSSGLCSSQASSLLCGCSSCGLSTATTPGRDARAIASLASLSPSRVAPAATLWAMPRPRNERQSLERELREELPAQLAAYQQELAGGSADKVRR